MIRWATDDETLGNDQVTPRIGIGTVIATGIVAVACGAALMYLLDPVSGRRRRHVLRDKAISIFRYGGEHAVHAAAGLGNRTRGLWHGVTHRWDHAVDDATLADRVKAALGHAARHVSGVRVHVQQGIVTLVGPVLHREAPAIVRAARHVRGVRDIIDRLEQRSDQQWARTSGGRISEGG